MAQIHSVHRLTEMNAPRHCAVCGEDAGYYVETDETSTLFLCDEHFVEVVR